MKNAKKIFFLFVCFCFLFLPFDSVKATGESCAQVNGAAVAQCVKGESAGWSGFWATKCPAGMNACAYYNHLQCGNCPTQGDVCCTTEEMANKAADDLSKNAPKFGTEAECKAKGGYCNWYSMSGCKTGEEMIAGCSETLSNAPCCIPKSTSSTSSSTPYRPDQPRDTGGLVPCDTNCTLCHIVIGFKRIFDFLLGLLFVATMLAITASGVFYMFSTGSKALIDLGKKAITYSITAFVIGMTSWLIVNTIMVMVGFKHPKGGNWWQFTCDTTKASPVGTAPKTGEGQPRPSGGGSCAGMNTTVQNQCELTSQDLEALMNCMSNQGAPGTVTSISDSVVGNNFEQARACCGSGSCKHASMSCHYGCGLADQGYSHAMDVAAGSSDEELCRVASIAKGCGAGRIWGPRTLSCGITFYEGHKHLHISTSACNH